MSRKSWVFATVSGLGIPSKKRSVPSVFVSTLSGVRIESGTAALYFGDELPAMDCAWAEVIANANAISKIFST